MTDGKNGQPPQPGLHEGVGKDGPTLEQVAAMNAVREVQMRMMMAQRREALAGIVLNGICSGLYSRAEELVEGFGDRAVNDAVVFADRLMARLAEQPKPAAANDQPAPPPKGDTAAGAAGEVNDGSGASA